MARIRTIKPEFWTDEDLSTLPEATHMLAAALLNYADDEGYFNANPKLIAADCCPLREPSVSIPESLRSLQAVGYLRLGSDDDGKRFGLIVGFEKHQRVSHPTPSKIKDKSITWESSGIIPEPSAKAHESFRPEQGKEQGTGKGKEARTRGPSPSDLEAFEKWYVLYPHKVGRGAAERAFASALKASSLDVLTEGVRRYVATKPQDVPWCNPATWLNGKRWLDQPAPQANVEAPRPTTDDAEYSRWKARMAIYAPGKFWADAWGNRPEAGKPPTCPVELYDAWKQRQQVAA